MYPCESPYQEKGKRIMQKSGFPAGMSNLLVKQKKGEAESLHPLSVFNVFKTIKLCLLQCSAFPQPAYKNHADTAQQDSARGRNGCYAKSGYGKLTFQENTLQLQFRQAIIIGI